MARKLLKKRKEYMLRRIHFNILEIAMHREMELYLNYLTGGRALSEHSVRGYRIDVEQFIAFVGEDVAVQAVAKEHLRSFVADLSAQGLKKSSIARKMSSVKMFFRHLEKEKRISAFPFEEVVSPKREQRLPRAAGQEEVERLFALADVDTFLGLRDRAIMELFYSSGLRLQELCEVNQADVDTAARRIRVRGKGKKERIVPVTAMAMLWLERLWACDEHPRKDAIFVNRFGDRLSVRSVDRMFRNYLLRSGLAGEITPHSLRHSVATHLLDRGMDLKKIQELLGHQSLSATMIYTKVSSARKKEVYDRSHPLVVEEGFQK